MEESSGGLFGVVEVRSYLGAIGVAGLSEAA